MKVYSSHNKRTIKITGCIIALIVVFSIALLTVFNVVWTIWKEDCEFSIVETRNGRIRGKLNRTLLEKRLFYSYRGIPFAKPPVDELRFKVKIGLKFLIWTNAFHYESQFMI